MTLINYGDNSLLGAEPNGINNYGVDEPDYAGGPLEPESESAQRTVLLQHLPVQRECSGHAGHRTAALLLTARDWTTTTWRCSRPCALTESKSLQFRLEAFNVFNHAQFFGPQSVDGNIGSSTFGQVVSADPPRLVQLGAKFFF